MPTNAQQADSLPNLIDALQERGRYVLSKAEALSALGTSEEALAKAARRLVAKGRLAIPREGFYLIVPLEYRSAGAPPPEWYIDDLMRYHGVPYYVGLLTAAELHGAAHQRPQVFQVVTPTQLRPAEAGRGRICFYRKLHLDRTPTQTVKTTTGYMRVSTPEGTAVDLVRYMRQSGHLQHIATVLVELAESLDAGRLVEAAKADGTIANAQRLGYLLDLVEAGRVADALADWVKQDQPRYLPAVPGLEDKAAPRDSRWRLYLNSTIEPDL